jgi:hypothetical protein
MKYISLDIETCGISLDTDIIQFAAVIDDLNDPLPIEELPKLNVYFLKDFYIGEPIALGMHSKIFEKIAHAKKNKIEFDEDSHYTDIQNLPYILRNFLTKNGINEDLRNGNIVVNVAGKNVGGFDMPFLKSKIKNWEGIYFRHRTIDPSILYFDLTLDREIPDTATCMKRANLLGPVAHTALEDAIVIVKLIRGKLL